MSSGDSKHVFLSYVREDSEQIDQLFRVLEAAQIPHWRDRSALGPGDAWRDKIREAIRGQSLVFLACFSDQSRAKDRSYMNEELTLAVEELRLRPPDRVWLIPVRLDDGELPSWNIGRGRTLDDLNYSDFFGPDLVPSAARLVTTIRDRMGEGADPVTTLEAVQQVRDVDRVDLVKRLTKELLLDPTRRIELDDLIAQEVRRVLERITDNGWLNQSMGNSTDALVPFAASEAERLMVLVEPFCASLAVAAKYAPEDSLGPWADGIAAFVRAALKEVGGQTVLLDMRHLPGVVAIFVATISASAARRWGNLRALVVDPKVRHRFAQMLVPVVDATDFWAPFPNSPDFIEKSLALSVQEDMSLAAAAEAAVAGKAPQYHTPVAEWLVKRLRPLFSDQLPDDDAFEAAFSVAEVHLGVIGQYLAALRRNSSSAGSSYSRWYGRSTWRARHFHENPVEDLRNELDAKGDQWEWLRAGLLGGDTGRADEAIRNYSAEFERQGGQQF